jgi:hypothetical protein
MGDQTLPPAAAIGTLNAYREFIAGTMASAGVHANLGVTYAEIGNDAGLDYAIRCLVACTRAAVSTLSDLKAVKAEQASRRGTMGEPADAL